MDYRNEAPKLVQDFLFYHGTMQNHSKKTVDEYFLDLRNFFRYIKAVKVKNISTPQYADLESIDISDVDLELIASVTISDVYSYMEYLSRDRPKHPNSDKSERGLNASSRARKVATIRGFYKYLTTKAKVLSGHPIQNLDFPRQKKTLPRYLDEKSSRALLKSVDGPFQERDWCILVLFLNCGLRISELIGLNVKSIRDNHIRILGKGGKERILYLNDSCKEAIQDYLAVRDKNAIDQDALFLSRRRTRISKAAVEKLVKKYLTKAGLDASLYSPHKLRHTAATLMLHNGVDVRTLQEVLGHEHLNTTQIYTHVDNEDLRMAAKAHPLGNLKKGKES